jgi:hypothetical protein
MAVRPEEKAARRGAEDVLLSIPPRPACPNDVAVIPGCAEGAGPESIEPRVTRGEMDSGLALRAPRNDEDNADRGNDRETFVCNRCSVELPRVHLKAVRLTFARPQMSVWAPKFHGS